MQALLDDGDEVLVPAPDYPLWTASVSLSGGTAVHYRCDEQADWMPDLADIERKVTDRTKAIVVINPNNPTGAVYDDELLRGTRSPRPSAAASRSTNWCCPAAGCWSSATRRTSC